MAMRPRRGCGRTARVPEIRANRPDNERHVPDSIVARRFRASAERDGDARSSQARGRDAKGSPSGTPNRSRSRGPSPCPKAGARPSSRRRCTAGRSSAPLRWEGLVLVGVVSKLLRTKRCRGTSSIATARARRESPDGGSVPPPCAGGGRSPSPGPFPQSPQGRVVRQVEVDRCHRDEPGFDRLEVGARDILAVQVIAADPVILLPLGSRFSTIRSP